MGGKSRLRVLDERSAGEGCQSSSVAKGDRAVQPDFAGRAAVITLGCAKNRVDSEVMVGVLQRAGYEVTTDLEVADVAVVNTCGFLQSSINESIDAILDVAEYKEKGRLRRLLVAGCLVERFKADNITETLPEVDGFLTTDDLLKVADAAAGVESSPLAGGRPYFLYDETMPRTVSTAGHSAYVKIAEGCDRPCAFCIIPKIRGAFRSRTIESVVGEVRTLGARGVREVNLVAQDLTSFGVDRGGRQLPQLLRELDGSKAVDWVRLLYIYPVGVTDELLDLVVELPSIVEYLDIPLQHASEEVLRNMQRPLGSLSPRNLVRHMRERYPSIRLRTTFIVGYPGETEAQVEELAEFVAEGHFSSVGVFTFSPEEGTPAGALDGQISEKEKRERRSLVMAAQRTVVEAQARELKGSMIQVLIEGPHPESELLLTGRSRFQAPEVDGVVIVNDVAPEVGMVEPGMLVECRITGARSYDLLAKVVRVVSPRDSALETLKTGCALENELRVGSL